MINAQKIRFIRKIDGEISCSFAGKLTFFP